MTLALALGTGGSAQQARAPQGAPPPTTQPPAGPPPNPNAAATAADHQNMMEQLGITTLRPGPSGNESAPNHANYDEALANPYPNLPEVLTLKNGKKVTSADTWWKQRRPEIVEDFDREVLGRVPRNVPEGGLARQPDREVRSGRTSGRRQGTDRRGGQLDLPGDHGRDPDDAS